MFLPLKDHNPTRTRPWVNGLLISINVLVLLITQDGPRESVEQFGIVPREVVAWPISESVTLLSSIFMHANWAHLISNLWFLYIFGDNIEDALGHAKYLGFYLACGLVAGLSQILVDPRSIVPIIGASGAVAGVVGAYLVLYPRAPIVAFNTILPLWFVLGVLPTVPAWLIALEFLLVNLLSGIASLGGGSGGGVAFFAHLGGFAAGFLMIRPVAARLRREQRHWQGWRTPTQPWRR